MYTLEIGPNKENYVFLYFSQLQWNQPTISLINDFLFISTFFICRILLFPFMYSAYARYKDLLLYQVPLSIPLKCNIACLAILLVQCVWFRLILKAAVRRVRSSRAKALEIKLDQPMEVNCNHVGKEKWIADVANSKCHQWLEKSWLFLPALYRKSAKFSYAHL